MPWVKRNLGLVIGASVALILMALAGFYLWTKIREDREVTAMLDEQTAAFQTLLNRPVHPGTERLNNIELAKEERERLNGFMEQVRSKFAEREIPTNISNREFRALLDHTVADLQRKAESLGITLPEKDYWFTFAPQKQAVEFKNAEMLTYQLMDVRDLSQILFDSKIHDLKRIKRVPASADDNNQTDFTDKKASTNEFTIVMPYELTFQGFSSELARVLEGLVNSPHCFVVTSVTALPATDDAQPSGVQPFQNNPYAQSTRYGGAYAPPVQPAYRPARPSNVLLDEAKLQFTLNVNSVRLKPEGMATPQADTQEVVQY